LQRLAVNLKLLLKFQQFKFLLPQFAELVEIFEIHLARA
jgi:hypothetical protein